MYSHKTRNLNQTRRLSEIRLNINKIELGRFPSLAELYGLFKILLFLKRPLLYMTFENTSITFLQPIYSPIGFSHISLVKHFSFDTLGEKTGTNLEKKGPLLEPTFSLLRYINGVKNVWIPGDGRVKPRRSKREKYKTCFRERIAFNAHSVCKGKLCTLQYLFLCQHVSNPSCALRTWWVLPPIDYSFKWHFFPINSYMLFRSFRGLQSVHCTRCLFELNLWWFIRVYYFLLFNLIACFFKCLLRTC